MVRRAAQRAGSDTAARRDCLPRRGRPAAGPVRRARGRGRRMAAAPGLRGAAAQARSFPRPRFGRSDKSHRFDGSWCAISGTGPRLRAHPAPSSVSNRGRSCPSPCCTGVTGSPSGSLARDSGPRPRWSRESVARTASARTVLDRQAARGGGATGVWYAAGRPALVALAAARCAREQIAAASCRRRRGPSRRSVSPDPRLGAMRRAVRSAKAEPDAGSVSPFDLASRGGTPSIGLGAFGPPHRAGSLIGSRECEPFRPRDRWQALGNPRPPVAGGLRRRHG